MGHCPLESLFIIIFLDKDMLYKDKEFYLHRPAACVSNTCNLPQLYIDLGSVTPLQQNYILHLENP